MTIGDRAPVMDGSLVVVLVVVVVGGGDRDITWVQRRAWGRALEHTPGSS